MPDAAKPSPAWLRPVRRRHSRSPTRESAREFASSASPASTADIAAAPVSPPKPQPPQQQPQQAPPSPPLFDEADFLATQASFGDLNNEPDDYVFSSEFFDLNAAASPPSPFYSNGGASTSLNMPASSPPIPNVNGFASFGEAMDFGGDFGGAQLSNAPPPNGTAGADSGLMDDLRDLGLPSAGMDGLMPSVEGAENLCVASPARSPPSICVRPPTDATTRFDSAPQVRLGNPQAPARGRL